MLNVHWEKIYPTEENGHSICKPSVTSLGKFAHGYPNNQVNKDPKHTGSYLYGSQITSKTSSQNTTIKTSKCCQNAAVF